MGVSQTTVSLALRNHPSIPPKKRQEIRRLAREAGYQVDPALGSVMAQTRRYATSPVSLALFIGTDPAFFQSTEPFHQFVAGVEMRCRELGYFLDRYWLFDGTTAPKRQAAMLRARGTKGIIILWPNDEPIPAKFAPLYRDFACAVIGSMPAAPSLHVAVPDHFMIGETAFAHALKAGYRRPAAILKPEHDAGTDHRLSLGCIAAQQRLGIVDAIPPLIVPHDSPKVVEFLDRQKPDFVLITQEEMYGFLAQFPRFKDLALYFWDITPRLHRTCSGINQNTQMIGAAGVDLVVGQIHRNERGVPEIQRCMVIAGLHSGAHVQPVSKVE